MTDIQVNLADYHHWTEHGRGIEVYMAPGMAERLQAEVLQAGAVEVGGILLGWTEAGPAGKVIVEDFVAVTSSYSRGPLFELCGTDVSRLESALLRAALAASESDSAPAVIGYFRSHHRDGLALSASDLAVAKSYFQGPNHVTLLVQPARGGNGWTAGFFFQGEGNAFEVKLGGAAPAAETAVRIRLFWRDFMLRAVIIALAAIAIVLLVLTYLGRRASPESTSISAPAAATLGLQVQRSNADLLVTWNRAAPEIASARRGTLFIRDGSLQKTLDLDVAQLTTGSVVYTPSGDDIQFRLEVQGGDERRTAETVRLLLPKVVR